MSTEVSANNSDLETSSLAPSSFYYGVTHIFFPVKLPEDCDYTLENELSLARAVCAAAHAYRTRVAEVQWCHVAKMLDNLQVSLECRELDARHIVPQLRGMQTGDILAFFIQSQNAALVLTRREGFTLFESFEVSPSKEVLKITGASLRCSYPCFAVETPNKVLDDEDFQFELANLLSRPAADNSDLPSCPGGSQYINILLTGILRAIGRTSDVPRIMKRIRDDIGKPQYEYSTSGVWRRSSLWLFIRITIQMSIDRSPLGRTSYKTFMLFFICTFARNTKNVDLPSELLHLMSSKIFRRLTKLGLSTPDWLSTMALDTCARLREILDIRWRPLSCRTSPFSSPSQEEIVRDTELFLPGSSEYIRNTLAKNDRENITAFHPCHRPRGTIGDFLSSNGLFFDEAYKSDSEVTLYDIEESVQQGIDNWITCVTNIEEASTQIEILMDKYMVNAEMRNPEEASRVLLTGLELFVALDKLAVKEIPMLADYCPGVPLTLLEKLFLRKAASFHRLSGILQYLSMRQSQSRWGWSMALNEITEDCFAVRYYDQSVHLQQLKARIEVEQRALGGDAAESPLPTSLLHAKVVVFELQCPACIRIWRSASARIPYYACSVPYHPYGSPGRDCLLMHHPVLQAYFSGRARDDLSIQFHFAYFHPSSQSRSPQLCYTIQYPSFGEDNSDLSAWRYLGDSEDWQRLRYTLEEDDERLEIYIHSTTHTSNDVLAAQVDCPADFSLDEFIAFAHLRSGGLLQWFNILRGLRSRTLNLRRPQVHFLIAQAILQAGPFDLNTGEWIWHQELQSSFFCDALLNELADVLADVGTGSIDGVMMNTISLLLTRMLASSPSTRVSERTIALLRSVRKKTFKWVQELSYDLAMAPTNEERRVLLRDMSVTCRSTFDLDSTFFSKIFLSAEDVDALLSSAIFIYALLPELDSDGMYSRLLLERDRHVFLALEDVLREMILIDQSDYGIDLAVRKLFVTHKPSIHRWKQLGYPNSRWLECNIEATGGRPSQLVYLNLLTGALQVDGKLLGGLPEAVRNSSELQQIFRDQGFFAIPSSLPGMGFTTLAITTDHRVHFSLRGDDLVVQALCNETHDTLELIPSNMLRRDLPPALVDGHVHWLNLSTKIIEIRPLHCLWEQSSENWKIDCKSGRYYAYRGQENLVCSTSPTWDMLSRCFACFDSRKNPEGHYNDILVTARPVFSLQSMPVMQLSVSLSDYALSFFVNERGELESRDFKNMVYDENQSVATLLGLKNLLVLRHNTSSSQELVPKRILIPNERRARKYGDHQVRFEHVVREPGQPLYHTYNVDTELGCLVGDGTVTSTQRLAYLHAMTSCHRPDPLTGKTGLQAGVSLLQSAGCWSRIRIELDQNHHYYWPYNQVVGYLGYEAGAYWDRAALNHQLNNASSRRAVRRAGYLLFPTHSGRPTSVQESEDVDYLIHESDVELEGVVFTAASSVLLWFVNGSTMNTILDWAALWNDVVSDTASHFKSLHDEPSPCDLVRTLVTKVHDILEMKERSYFRLLFLLPTLAYCSPSHQLAFLSMFVTFAKQSHYSWNPLIYAGCKISDGYRPTEEVIRHYVLTSRIKEQNLAWELEKQSMDSAIKTLLKNWPSSDPLTISLDSRFWDVKYLISNLQPLFSSCRRNFTLKRHLMNILAGPSQQSPSHLAVHLQHIFDQPFLELQITLDQLISRRTAPELPPRSRLQRESRKGNKGTAPSMYALHQLFASLPTARAFQQQYTTQLDASAQRLREESQVIHKVAGKDLIGTVKEYYAQCRVNYFRALDIVEASLNPVNPCERTLHQYGLWPSFAAGDLLQCLASTSTITVPSNWKKCLTSLALLLLDVQRARRLLRFALDDSEEEFSRELENEGCDGWDPEANPDWLLIQIQGNFLIRRTQAETAAEMISPRSGKSTVMQVNMGEGKSSVIIPIAAASLANGENFVRVIVPKTLTSQMFEILVARLGWLTNRPIYYLPFARSPEYDRHGDEIGLGVDDLRRLMFGCMEKRGILLVQPEHVASLKMMTIEEQIRECGLVTESSSAPVQQLVQMHLIETRFFKSLPNHGFVSSMFQLLGRSQNRSRVDENVVQANHHHDRAENFHGTSYKTNKWLNLQKWIHAHARDILDESDEILHSRFQLIYTIGIQQHMDGYPDRWTITQQVLRLVKGCAYTLSKDHPNSIQYENGPPGSFPYVRIVRDTDGGRRLISLIVEDVMIGRLHGFNFQNITQELYDAIRSFISDEDAFQVPETVTRVEEYAKNSNQSHLWSGLLLLRGLLASNILCFALTERRWRVDYGLDLQQVSSKTPTTLLAVPFRAKDVPAPNTHFGHPDITVILTCLSYYYAGLNKEQLRTAFEALLDEDDPTSEYARWVEEYDDYDSEMLPGSLHRLNEINLRSSEQWDNVIFPLFTQNHAAVDFYLSRVVFPKEAKEFPRKLSVSSWDLAEQRDKLITGFSGTNDGRWLLPMSITQRDLGHQQGANAKVLAYLLQPENDFYMEMEDSDDGERLITPRLLKMIAAQRPNIRVLLDVGAQILDLSNREVAKVWLDIIYDAAGAVYFDEKDQLMVLARNGVTQPMLSSPLSQKLDQCVVYLDHAHTRGTDINLPAESRAAVTLGPKVKKDSLVQGCMRMRKLGRGHSVMFFAPPEVDRSIRAVSTKKDPKTQITSAEVLCWAIHETWKDIQQRAPYWAQQGMKHKLRHDAWIRFCNNDLMPEELSKAWLESESKSLADLYAPSRSKNAIHSLSQLDPGIRQRCKDLGVLSLPSVQMEEEQEREVNREREREREVELPPEAQSTEHYLHPDVEVFIKTGLIPPLHSGSAFRPVFTTLERSFVVTHEADVWSPFILATADFCNTIKPESTKGTIDQYLRPVQWIVSSKRDRCQVLVLLSQFEVDRVLSDIRESDQVHLHMYAPRTSQRMKPSDDLRLYTIPPLPYDWTPPWDLIDQLNVFSGQLYLRDHMSYLRLYRFLAGVSGDKSRTEVLARRNMFSIPGSFEEIEITFSNSPLPFVMELLAIRSKGRPFAHTHMGRILQGQLLTEKDFEEASSVKRGFSDR